MKDLAGNLEERIKGRKFIETYLAEYCRKDESFKQELFNNPKYAIGKAIGIEIPENIEIKIVQQEVESVYLVMPFKPVQFTAPVELTDIELESVNGGSAANTITILTMILNKLNGSQAS